jgi:hypothetical protein
MRILPTLDKKTIQNLSAGDEQQLQALKIDRQAATRLQTLKALQDENDTAREAIRGYREQIAKIRPTLMITSRPRILPPDQNSNISSTSLQLTFERLKNNLRLPVP